MTCKDCGSKLIPFGSQHDFICPNCSEIKGPDGRLLSPTPEEKQAKIDAWKRRPK